MGTILVLVERAGPKIDESTWELATVARRLAGADGTVVAALLGSGVQALSSELTEWFDEVVVADHARLQDPDGVAYAEVLAGVIATSTPAVTLIAHTNVGMDIAPTLAARVGLPLVADCLEIDATANGLAAVRAMFGGKVHARVTVTASSAGSMATVRPGAFDASAAPGVGGSVSRLEVKDDIGGRRRPLETVTPEAGAVDLTQAEVLVSVGRGIEEEDNLDMVRSLAEALGAELACTRPIVDKGWLPKNHQVGTSGVTVKPRVYLAIGVSGSFQHMGGIKGGPFLAAVNKDPGAPIFGVADVGIVGDLFDIVPLLEEKIRETKG